MAVTARQLSASTYPTYFTSGSGSNIHLPPQTRNVPATQLRLSRPYPHQMMPMMQRPDTPTSSLHDPFAIGCNGLPAGSHSDQQSIASAATGHGISFFDDVFNYSDEQMIFGEGLAAQQWRGGQYNPTSMSFRAMDSATSSANSNSSSDASSSFARPDMFGPMDLAGKMNRNRMLPSPDLLPHQVDTSMYENVEDDAWVMSSVEYEAHSPSSVDTNSNGPLTPVSPENGDVFGRSFSSADGLLGEGLTGLSKNGGIEQALHPLPRTALNASRVSFSSACQCPTCQGAFTQQASLAQIWNAAQPPTISTNYKAIQLNESSASQSGTAQHADNDVISAAPLLGNHHVLDSMLTADRSAMDTTPEVSDDGEEEGSNDHDDDISEADVNDQAVAEASHRRNRDRFLLKMREQGLSYREIKRRGRFSEAESTLRGRVRVLTKDKSERVGKPEWTAKDLQLLHRAVDRWSEPDILDGTRNSQGRIPWKKISTWMKANGSTYTFAAATCAKKWREMN